MARPSGETRIMCKFAQTCMYRLRYGDTESGCTAKSSCNCDFAKINRVNYPMIHIKRMDKEDDRI